VLVCGSDMFSMTYSIAFISHGLPVWNPMTNISHGSNPKICVHAKSSTIMVVYTSAFGKTKYQCGMLNVQEAKKITWKKPEDLNVSKLHMHPDITITETGYVIIVTEKSNTVHYHFGQLSVQEHQTTWISRGVVAQGIKPSITTNLENIIVVAYNNEETKCFHCKTGLVNQSLGGIVWVSDTIGAPKFVTSIALDNTNLLVCAVETFKIIDQMHSEQVIEIVIGAVDPKNGAIDWKLFKSCVAHGCAPSIAVNTNYDLVMCYQQNKKILWKFGKLLNAQIVNWI